MQFSLQLQPTYEQGHRPYSPVEHCISVLYRPPSLSVTFLDNFCIAIQFISPNLFSSFVLVGILVPIFVHLKLQGAILQMFSSREHSHPHCSQWRNITLTWSLYVSNPELLLDYSGTDYYQDRACLISGTGRDGTNDSEKCAYQISGTPGRSRKFQPA